ncbi:hypothetical protein NEAUS04_0369 [Nematocida ausubeli]|nr:hypothetical protein NEAUS04_0276 [Nematocida ausubeli]KAI5161213.1 hypothetical protein NEAUS04_0369 [Nematocida ausubeli]
MHGKDKKTFSLKQSEKEFDDAPTLIQLEPESLDDMFAIFSEEKKNPTMQDTTLEKEAENQMTFSSFITTVKQKLTFAPTVLVDISEPTEGETSNAKTDLMTGCMDGFDIGGQENSGGSVNKESSANSDETPENNPKNFFERMTSPFNGFSDYMYKQTPLSYPARNINKIEKLFSVEQKLLNGILIVVLALLLEVFIYLAFKLRKYVLFGLMGLMFVRYLWKKTLKDGLIMACSSLMLISVILIGILDMIAYVLTGIYVFVGVSWVERSKRKIYFSDIIVLTLVWISSVSLFMLDRWVDLAATRIDIFTALCFALWISIIFNAGILRSIFLWIKEAVTKTSKNEQKQEKKEKQKQEHHIVTLQEQEDPSETSASSELVNAFIFSKFWILAFLCIAISTAGLIVGTHCLSEKTAVLAKNAIKRIFFCKNIEAVN